MKILIALLALFALLLLWQVNFVLALVLTLSAVALLFYVLLGYYFFYHLLKDEEPWEESP